MSAALQIEHSQILNSWKEIAGYLNRTVRTVQRWEATGLPVHRPVSAKRSVVVAFRWELDQWLLRAPLGSVNERPKPRRAKDEIHVYTTQTRFLSVQLKSKTDELTSSLQRLMDSIKEMRTLNRARSGFVTADAENAPTVEDIVRRDPRPGFDRTSRPA